MFEESRIMPILAFFKDSLWPGGKLKPPGQPRSTQEITSSRDEANRKLSALVPGLLGFLPYKYEVNTTIYRSCC
jgi:sorting nexin-25